MVVSQRYLGDRPITEEEFINLKIQHPRVIELFQIAQERAAQGLKPIHGAPVSTMNNQK